MKDPVWVWGLPLSRMTRTQTVDAVRELVRAGQPASFITANTQYAMLTQRDPSLRAVNARSAFLVADGMPLVWASRLRGSRLPERVAGSDLIYDLCRLAAGEGCGVFFLGGAEGVADEAVRRLIQLYPGLRVVGAEAPDLESLSAAEEEGLRARIRAAQPQILFVAFGQPKGERWIDANRHALGVPVSVQVGASLDFVAGRIPRAPRRLQQIGLEWAYRVWREPARLAPRYARNARFILTMLARDLASGFPKGPARDPIAPAPHRPLHSRRSKRCSRA